MSEALTAAAGGVLSLGREATDTEWEAVAAQIAETAHAGLPDHPDEPRARALVAHRAAHHAVMGLRAGIEVAAVALEAAFDDGLKPPEGPQER